MELFNQLLQKVYDANGFALSLVGMTVVFSGLITLYFTMLVLKKTTTGRSEKKAAAAAAETEIEMEEEEMDMDEVAAVIGLALNLHVLRSSPKKMTIKRLSRSSWKETLRARAMERL
jgi:Na+-transporting methylmalonyl-CoA/oxaloacetate decarboxylase gamma subunit